MSHPIAKADVHTKNASQNCIDQIILSIIIKISILYCSGYKNQNCVKYSLRKCDVSLFEYEGIKKSGSVGKMAVKNATSAPLFNSVRVPEWDGTVTLYREFLADLSF